MTRRSPSPAAALLLLATVTFACGRGDTASIELQRVRSGATEVVLLSSHEALRHGNDRFFVEFRSSADGSLVDAGEVRGSATMPMPGMPMFGSIAVKPTGTVGRYAVESSFEMAGTWRMTLEWQGGSATFSTSVQ